MKQRGRPKQEPTKIIFRRVPLPIYAEIIEQIQIIINKYKTK